MQITDIRVYVLKDQLWKPWFLMIVDTDEEIRGLGQAGTTTDFEAKEAHIEKFREWFLGIDPLNVESLRVQSQETPWGLTELNQALLSGLEIACWDIKGKYRNVPAHDLLGGKVRDRVKTYANRWYGDLDTPEEWADGAEQVLSQGYDTIKFEPFERVFRDITNRDLQLVEDRLAAIRDRVGPSPDLLIEGHGRMTPATAIKVGRAMEPYNPGWFEAPILPHQGPEAYREVNQALDIPIADDLASTDSKFSALDYISERAIDIIQPDPILIGGIRETQYVAQMADAAAIMTCPHAAAGPVSLCANIHISAVIPNFKIQESDNFTHPEWIEDVFDTSLDLSGGYIEVPDEPGLGITLDEDKAAEHTDGPLEAEHNIFSESFSDSFT